MDGTTMLGYAIMTPEKWQDQYFSKSQRQVHFISYYGGH